MAREVAAREVGQRHRQHQRHFATEFVFELLHRHDPGLGVERVEHRLDQDEIGPAVDQRGGLFVIDFDQVVPVDLAEAGVVDIGREREGLVGRADRPGDKARAAVLGSELVGDLSGEASAGQVDFAHQMFGAIVRLADPVGGKGVRFGDIGPGLEIGAMDRFRHFRLGQGEDVVVALLVLRKAQRSGIVGFGQLPALDLGAEGPVDDQDALGRFGQQGFARGHDWFSLGRRPSRWQIA